MSIKVSITGDLGSGKTTVCDIISKQMHLKKYHMGGIQRSIAEKHGMDTHSLNIYAETHPEIDEEIDNVLKVLNDKEENIIVDSRMAWHFIPSSFKVFLTVDVTLAAERIMQDDKAGGRKECYSTVEEASQKIRERKASENTRYLIKYGVNCNELSNFDLVLDTSNMATVDVATKIMEEYKLWAGNR